MPGAGRSATAESTLSEALRNGSLEQHRAAEGSPFVARLMDGRLDAGDYLAYLERLEVVYRVLEDAVTRHRANPLLAQVHDERLLRSPSLAADVAHWRRHVATSTRTGANAGSVASPVVAAYVEQVRRAADRPWLLIAHHYTRYLGDLSGGRILARGLAGRFGPRGLAFYDFAQIQQPVAYKRDYRDRLDRLPLTTDQRHDLMLEVRAAFESNRLLLAELD